MFMMVVLTLLMYFYTARQQSTWSEAVRFLGVLYQIQGMGLGRLDFRTIALHMSVCVFTLFLTVKLLEIDRSR
jgi:ABC-2 type transport system permease protein